ncbi:MAG: hypothetical protein ACOY7T_12320 [Pseudomonadota bacterium]
METTLTLIDRLRQSADRWREVNDATLAKLGRLVINDGGFFSRIEAPGASTTTATLERFARFLGDPANWREGAVPDVVAEFVHAVGVSPEPAATATGQAGEMSGLPTTTKQAAA